MGARSGGKDSSRSAGKDSILSSRKIFAMKASTRNFSPLQTKSTVIQNSLTQPLSTRNKYNIGDKPLSDFNDVDMSNVNNNKESEKVKEKIRNPPIIITGSSVSDIQNICNSVIKSKKYEIKLLRIGIRVQIVEKKEFDLLNVHLVKEKIAFFKYHTTETRPRKIVLKGLQKMEIDDLKKILEEMNIMPTEIKSLRLRENHYNYDHEQIYILYFESGTIKLSELRKEEYKYINNTKITWEPYTPRSRDKYPQCRNCQMYGHSSINCHMPTRCLVCALDHKTDDCPKKLPKATLEIQRINGVAIDKSFVKCANCGENHPASYNGCIARRSYIDVQNKFNRRSNNQSHSNNYKYDQNEFPQLEIPTSNKHISHMNYQSAVRQPAHQDTNTQLMLSMMTTVNNLIDKLSTMIEQLTRALSNISLQKSP